MARRAITDEIWSQLLAAMEARGCYDAKNSREVMEAILWKLRTGAQWREVPHEFCPWQTAFGRFNEWSKIDGTYVRAHHHQDASGARRGANRAIGRSRGGPTTKIHMVVDAHGNPVDFEITGGEVHDVKAAPEVIRKIGSGENLIADKGYDSEGVRQQVRDQGMNPVIPRKSNSKKPNPEFDKFLYKMRHLVENLFARIKRYRSIVTRFEKLARNFKSLVYLARSMIWVRVGR